jgi:hypothetical protein
MMDGMRFLLRFSLFLTLILVSTSIILRRHYEVFFPRNPGPELDLQARFDDGAYIEQHHPEIALLGVDPDLLAEKTGKSVIHTRQLDFNARLGDSYLPELVRLAQENNIKIIFVRIKVESDPDSPALNDYLQDLSEYLEGKASYYLDFGDDPRLTHDLFQDSVHLNEKGKILFTELLANELIEIFARE